MRGSDKGLVTWNGRSLALTVKQRLESQTMTPSSIWISANRNLADYARLGATGVITDERPDFVGPLAGVESALRHVHAPLLLVVPCDTPLLPLNLFESLHQPIRDNPSLDAAYALAADTRHHQAGGVSEGQAHPLCCLLRTNLLDNLSEYLDQGQQRVMGWMDQIHAKALRFNDSKAFANVNDLETLAALRSAP